MNDENRRLREKLSLITTQVKALPGGACLAMSVSDVASPPRTKIVPLSGGLAVVWGFLPLLPFSLPSFLLCFFVFFSFFIFLVFFCLCFFCFLNNDH